MLKKISLNLYKIKNMNDDKIVYAIEDKYIMHIYVLGYHVGNGCITYYYDSGGKIFQTVENYLTSNKFNSDDKKYLSILDDNYIYINSSITTIDIILENKKCKFVYKDNLFILVCFPNSFSVLNIEQTEYDIDYTNDNLNVIDKL